MVSNLSTQRTILFQLIYVKTWLNKRSLDESSSLIFSKTKHPMLWKNCIQHLWFIFAGRISSSWFIPQNDDSFLKRTNLVPSFRFIFPYKIIPQSVAHVFYIEHYIYIYIYIKDHTTLFLGCEKPAKRNVHGQATGGGGLRKRARERVFIRYGVKHEEAEIKEWKT